MKDTLCDRRLLHKPGVQTSPLRSHALTRIRDSYLQWPFCGLKRILHVLKSLQKIYHTDPDIALIRKLFLFCLGVLKQIVVP